MLWLLFLVGLAFSSIETIDRLVYVIEGDSVLYVERQFGVCEDDPDYYIPAQEIYYDVDKDLRELRWYVSWGTLPTKVYENTTQETYEVSIPRLDAGDVFTFGYRFLPKYYYIGGYKKNRHFYVYGDEDADIDVYLCIKKPVLDYKEYNVFNIEDPFNISLNIPPLDFNPYRRFSWLCDFPDPCPSGYKRVWLGRNKKLFTYSYSPNIYINQINFTVDNISVSLPSTHENVLRPIIANSSVYLLKLPEYNLTLIPLSLLFIDDKDLFFKYKATNVLFFSASNGTSVFKTGLLVAQLPRKQSYDPLSYWTAMSTVLDAMITSILLNETPLENSSFLRVYSDYLIYQLSPTKLGVISEIYYGNNTTWKLLKDYSQLCPGWETTFNGVLRSIKGNFILENSLMYSLYQTCGDAVSDYDNNGIIPTIEQFNNLIAKYPPNKTLNYSLWRDYVRDISEIEDYLKRGFVNKANQRLADVSQYLSKLKKLLVMHNKLSSLWISNLSVKYKIYKDYLDCLETAESNLRTGDLETAQQWLRKCETNKPRVIELQNLVERMTLLKQEIEMSVYPLPKGLNITEKFDLLDDILRKGNLTQAHTMIQDLDYILKEYNESAPIYFKAKDGLIPPPNWRIASNLIYAYKLNEAQHLYDNAKYNEALAKLKEAKEIANSFYIDVIAYGLFVGGAFLGVKALFFKK